MFANQTVLVLAPHTDDGEFGCGGTIARLCEEGARVVYVAFSAAEQSVLPHLPPDVLRHEVRIATKLLGVQADDCIVLNFEVRNFSSSRQQVLDSMVELNRRFAPSLVLMPSLADFHQDHNVVAHEGFRAFKKTSILSYEVPWNNLEFRTSSFFVLTPEQAEKKVAAVAAYKSQAHRAYASEEALRAVLTMRGIQIGTRYAEAFEVVRWVVN